MGMPTWGPKDNFQEFVCSSHVLSRYPQVVEIACPLSHLVGFVF